MPPYGRCGGTFAPKARGMEAAGMQVEVKNPAAGATANGAKFQIRRDQEQDATALVGRQDPRSQEGRA